MPNKKVMRYDVADFLLIKKTGKYAFMGVGFNTLNEDVGAQTEDKTYICDKNESSSVKGYKTKFSYDLDVMYNDAEDEEAADIEAVQELYFIGRNQAVGTDAERYYVRVDLWLPAVSGSTRYFKARKFKVAVVAANNNGAGGEALTGSGSLNTVGNPELGYWDTVTQKFTEGNYNETLGTLTVNSVAGATTGATKITITEPLTSGYSYMYKTALSVTAPSLNDSCTGYTPWDGTSDITATTGNMILVVEVDNQYKAKNAGTTTVTAKA